MDIHEILRNYTHNESPIFSKQAYQEMLSRWPNEEEMEVYRGINFPTKKAYDDFIQKFKENGGYLTSSASGFAKSLETAEDFASTTKTYFPTLAIMERESARQAMHEEVTGYCGVIIKTTIKPNQVVDVTRSEHAIEDEVLFPPESVIKSELIPVKTYKQTVEAEGFNLNKYVQNHSLENGICMYIVANHSKDLSSKSRRHLLDGMLKKIENQSNDYGSDIDVLDSGKYWFAYKSEIFSREYEKEKEYSMKFAVPDFKSLDLHGLWNPAQLKEIKKVSEEIIFSALQLHLQYRDKMHIDYSSLQPLTPYIGKFTAELYQRAVSYKKRESYETINENLKNLFSKKTESTDFNKDVKKEIDKLKNLLESIGYDSVKTKKDRIIEKEEFQERREKILSKATF